jgi:TonB family protein
LLRVSVSALIGGRIQSDSDFRGASGARPTITPNARASSKRLARPRPDGFAGFSMSIRGIFAVLLLAGWAPLASGQHFLAVKNGDKMSVVVAAKASHPIVSNGGKLEVVRGTQFALGEGGQYLPVHVSVRHLWVETSSAMIDTGGEINREFHLKCDLETAFPLEQVFLVIVFKNDQGEKGLFLFEVGRLEPRRLFPVSLAVPMTLGSAPGHYDLYLFSGGRELFQSMMPIGAMESALNRMVHERIQDLRDSPASPFIGPAPEYPSALYKKGIDGSATLSFAIDANGAVSDPKLVAASRPEFGDAAMAVIRLWRFLPTVKNGHPVPTRAEMPFAFTVPGKK